MMNLILGRDAATGKLRVSANGKASLIGLKENVPKSVSREHISITIEDDGTMVLRNLNTENDTYVNGMGVEVKQISKEDRIELSEEHYSLSWDILGAFVPMYVDIRPLRQIWHWYDTTQLEMRESERKAQNVQRLSGILSSCGILFMFFEGLGPIRFILTGLSVIIAVYFFVRGNNSDSSLNIKLYNLGNEFRKKYICPNPKCHHFMGNTPYDILIQNRACPYCKALYKK